MFHLEPYSPLSPAELEHLQDRGVRMYAEADEAEAVADEKRERADGHAEQPSPATRARYRRHAAERAVAAALYPAGDVSQTTTARPARRAA